MSIPKAKSRTGTNMKRLLIGLALLAAPIQQASADPVTASIAASLVAAGASAATAAAIASVVVTVLTNVALGAVSFTDSSGDEWVADGTP